MGPRTLSGATAQAVYADSEESLRQEIDVALKQRKDVRYVTVKGAVGSEVFPVYAQVLRTETHLLVRSYSSMYAYDLTAVKVLYRGQPVVDIPLVSAKGLDQNLRKLAARTTGKIKKACSDCIAVLSNPTRGNHLATSWAGVQDPWQKNPDYVAWTGGVPQSSAAAPLGKRPDEVVRCYNAGTTCYYYSFSSGPVGPIYSQPGTIYVTPPGGTSAGCAYQLSSCYMIDGDDANVLNYETGEGGVYTSSPWGCQGYGSNWFSSVDSKRCSPWQVFFYTGNYSGANMDTTVQQQLPAFAVAIELGKANIPGSTIPIPQGGHLYLETYVNGQPQQPMTIQAAPVNGLLQQHTFERPAITDPHFFFAKSAAGALTLNNTIMSDMNVYSAYVAAHQAPVYGVFVLNSNTWVDGLLIAVGYNRSTIGLLVNGLEVMGDRNALAFDNGYQIAPLF